MSPTYLFKRCGLMLYTLLVVTIIVFGVTQVLPADAATMLLGENATPEQLAALRARLGLNDPFWLQYFRWLGGTVRGEFGVSMRTGQLVLPVILEALSRSLLLAFLSIGLMLIVAIPLGIAAATRRGRLADITLGLFSYVGVSLPEFVTATLAILLLADTLKLLPATGYVPLTLDPANGLRHLVLPVFTISLILVAHVSRMVRSELVDALHSDYVRAARMKGLSERRVVFVHALRNALLPTITIVALDVGYVLGGIIVVEEIFAIPGIGRQIVVAIQSRDLPMIQAGALMLAVTYATMNLVADLAYAMLDKRIQYE
jgi:peptide/nickel transport system permease protein